MSGTFSRFRHWRYDRKQLRAQPRTCAPESQIRLIFIKEEAFDSKGRIVFRAIQCRRFDDNVEVVTESWVVARCLDPELSVQANGFRAVEKVRGHCVERKR